jgi:hypothetical protein
MKNVKLVQKIGFIILIVWIWTLLFGFLKPIGFVFINNRDLYLNFNDYKKEKHLVDSLISGGIGKGETVNYYGYIRNKNTHVIFLGNGVRSRSEIGTLFNEYEKNDKYLNIWVSPNSKDAYFDTPALNNTTQLQLWYQPLTEIFIFILMTFILVRWSKYFKKELSKYGLTTSEFHKLRKDGKLDEYLKNYESN